MNFNPSGPFRIGDRVQLTDEKGKLYSINLIAGGQFHTHKGWLEHDVLIGAPEGTTFSTNAGTKYQAFRPLLTDFVLSMPRGATIVYPKDAALILGYADIFPGAKVLEAGAGSGALSISLLRAVGAQGLVHSFEKREDFALIAESNVIAYFGDKPKHWQLSVGAVQEIAHASDFDRVILDMLAPWDCVEMGYRALKPGGVFAAYVATTTQLSKLAEALKEDGRFTEPESFEGLIRGWHHEGLAVRPQHKMNAHTGFIIFARKVAEGTIALKRRRRPAKGAYGAADDE
ncbi:MAG: tRNA (adenine-N1)-methyltransferase [Acidobacteria bacterium]|nr:tRNA (adenine-N1)-methyltransferase [Acidobacteriota bacterium]